MKTLFTHSANRFAVQFAIGSFLVGSLLFLLYLATRSDQVLGFGLLFVVLEGIFTPFLLLYLFAHLLFRIQDIREHLYALCLVLLNVPIAFLYLYLIN